MRPGIAFAATLLLLASSPAASLPGDAAAGKRLHDAHCTKCHGTEVYTRSNRRVKTLEALKQQVDHCVGSVQAGFSAGQTQDLVAYLNQQFYRFPAAPGAATPAEARGFLAAARARDFELAIKLAGTSGSAAERDRRYALVVDRAIVARDFTAADKAARRMSTAELRDEQFKKIVGSCPAN